MQVNFPSESWGPHPSSDSERKLNLFLFSRPPNMVGKGTLRSCSYSSLGCKEKRTGRTKFVVFHLLTGLIAVGVTVAFAVAPSIYRCFPVSGKPGLIIFIELVYQLGPDFPYSNTITNRVRIVVGSDIFRIASQN